MLLKNILINGKKISDFKITCDKSHLCPWIINPTNVYDMHSLVRDYCSKKGIGCETRYGLLMKEIK